MSLQMLLEGPDLDGILREVEANATRDKTEMLRESWQRQIWFCMFGAGA